MYELQGLNAAPRGMPRGPGIGILCMCMLKLWLFCARTAALGPERSSYKVDVAVVYIAQTNGLVKKAIERGALPHPRLLFMSGCQGNGRPGCRRRTSVRSW